MAWGVLLFPQVDPLRLQLGGEALVGDKGLERARPQNTRQILSDTCNDDSNVSSIIFWQGCF